VPEPIYFIFVRRRSYNFISFEFCAVSIFVRKQCRLLLCVGFGCDGRNYFQNGVRFGVFSRRLYAWRVGFGVGSKRFVGERLLRVVLRRLVGQFARNRKFIGFSRVSGESSFEMGRRQFRRSRHYTGLSWIAFYGNGRVRRGVSF
jgi:hypothetical protein